MNLYELDDSARHHLQQLRKFGKQLWQYEHSVINLIASDNAYPAALSRGPTYLGHMIQEGLVGERPFAGAMLHDQIERLAQTVACETFTADHANLQPHSCSQANQSTYHALLRPGDTVLALGFKAGGHLTHGLTVNFSGRLYRFVHYGLGQDEYIDYRAALTLALEMRPKLIVCGSSSYPRMYDVQQLRDIADSVDAPLMLDLSHEAGLIAGGAVTNPVPLADVVTMSMDKTLRGPFGAIVLARAQLASSINLGVHPGTQSSFSIRRLTDTAHALLLTRSSAFRTYAHNVIANAKTLERIFLAEQVPMITGGTDKHFLVLDVRRRFGLSGTEAEGALQEIGILTNRQTLPSDSSKRQAEASGLRIGTAWATSRGYAPVDFEIVAELVITSLSRPSTSVKRRLRTKVRSLTSTLRPNDVWRTL